MVVFHIENERMKPKTRCGGSSKSSIRPELHFHVSNKINEIQVSSGSGNNSMNNRKVKKPT